MAVKVVVRAKVIDIRRYKPKAGERVFVDTNALVWYSYRNSLKALPSRRRRAAQSYISYIDNALHAKTLLFCSGLTSIEMIHSIESIEREDYEYYIGAGVLPKEFRHNLTAERAKVERSVQNAWRRITKIAQMIGVTVDDAMVQAVLTRLKTQQLDGYDYIQAEAAHQAGIVNILTDDADYLTIAGATVLTANQNSIDHARNAGLLLNS